MLRTRATAKKRWHGFPKLETAKLSNFDYIKY
jgi:hypothetical protein